MKKGHVDCWVHIYLQEWRVHQGKALTILRMLARPLGSAWDVNFTMSLVSMRDCTDSSTETLHYNEANVHAPHGGEFKQASKKCRMSPAVPVRVHVSVVLTIFWYGDASVEKVKVQQHWGQLTTWPPNGKIFPSVDFFFIFKDDNARSQLY